MSGLHKIIQKRCFWRIKTRLTNKLVSIRMLVVSLALILLLEIERRNIQVKNTPICFLVSFKKFYVL